jgi:hypothetical protein
MSSVNQIRESFQSVLSSAIPGLNAYREVEDVVEAPAVVAIPRKADFAGALQRGLDTWEFDLYVLVRRREGGYAQQELDQYITGNGPKSIRRALYEHPTLGLPDTDAFVKGVDGYGGQFQVARIHHVGAILKVTVRTDGSV